MNLYDEATSLEFYEKRYEGDYMDTWDEVKKERVLNLLLELELPAQGRALDFGCGTGEFTSVLRRALPGWDIHGADVSRNAVAKAGRKHASEGQNFYVLTDKPLSQQFDLVFTHHVLEHVPNLEAAAGQMAECVAPGGLMVHILPCGNPGSLEARICRMRTNGIERDRQNRFFFEDPGHVRRLDTCDARALFATIGFVLDRAYYANHFLGALDWISQSGPYIVNLLLDTGKAKDPVSRLKLHVLRAVFLPLEKLRASLRGQGVWWLPQALARVTDDTLRRKASEEWMSRRADESGSEMYLVFRRADGR